MQPVHPVHFRSYSISSPRNNLGLPVRFGVQNGNTLTENLEMIQQRLDITRVSDSAATRATLAQVFKYLAIGIEEIGRAAYVSKPETDKANRSLQRAFRKSADRAAFYDELLTGLLELNRTVERIGTHTTLTTSSPDYGLFSRDIETTREHWMSARTAMNQGQVPECRKHLAEGLKTFAESLAYIGQQVRPQWPDTITVPVRDSLDKAVEQTGDRAAFNTTLFDSLSKLSVVFESFVPFLAPRAESLF